MLRQISVERLHLNIPEINIQFLLHIRKTCKSVNNDAVVHLCPDDFSAVREALEKAGIPMVEAQVAMVPQTYVELTDEQDVKNLQRTLDLLDEDDDVTDVWTNWDE